MIRKISITILSGIYLIILFTMLRDKDYVSLLVYDLFVLPLIVSIIYLKPYKLIGIFTFIIAVGFFLNIYWPIAAKILLVILSITLPIIIIIIGFIKTNIQFKIFTAFLTLQFTRPILNITFMDSEEYLHLITLILNLTFIVIPYYLIHNYIKYKTLDYKTKSILIVNILISIMYIILWVLILTIDMNIIFGYIISVVFIISLIPLNFQINRLLDKEEFKKAINIFTAFFILLTIYVSHSEYLISIMQ